MHVVLANAGTQFARTQKTTASSGKSQQSSQELGPRVREDDVQSWSGSPRSHRARPRRPRTAARKILSTSKAALTVIDALAEIVKDDLMHVVLANAGTQFARTQKTTA